MQSKCRFKSSVSDDLGGLSGSSGSDTLISFFSFSLSLKYINIYYISQVIGPLPKEVITKKYVICIYVIMLWWIVESDSMNGYQNIARYGRTDRQTDIILLRFIHIKILLTHLWFPASVLRAVRLSLSRLLRLTCRTFYIKFEKKQIITGN